MSAQMKAITSLESKGLYQKLVEIMEEIGRVEKRGFNSFHNYAYVKEDDLVEAVRGKLSERGILLLPTVESVTREGTLTTAMMSFTFVDSATGETQIAGWAGTGDDKGDKGLYKAYTGAEKYFLMKTFLIPTGDDPEGDEKTDKRVEKKPVTPKQLDGGASRMRRPTERETLLDGVQQVCGLLNKAGDEPQWTKARLKEFVKTELAAASVDDLAMEEVRELIKRLSLRLDDRKKNRPQPQGPYCDCGIARVRVDGIIAKGKKNAGKPWAAFMCANKVKGHEPVWIDLEAEESQEESETNGDDMGWLETD